MNGLDEVIKHSSKLPSLPAVALHVVELANRPEVHLRDVAKVVAMDPALAGKLLRFANSPAYSAPQQVESLNRAIVLMGMTATLNVALSFTLVSSMRLQQGNGLDYQLFWRRSLAAAACARVFGEAVKEPALEELFLAGLLQDIGMLAIDRVDAEFYGGLGEAQRDHVELQAYEKALMDKDHSYLAVWLLRKWGLHERTIAAVQHSHAVAPVRDAGKHAGFVHCVMLSNQLAELFVNEDASSDYPRMVRLAKMLLDIDERKLGKVLERARQLIGQFEKLFELGFDGDSVIDILASANEALMLRNVDMAQQLEALKGSRPPAAADSEAASPAAAPSKADKWRDPLTGVSNEAFLQHHLQQTFTRATSAKKAFSLALLDLDNFTAVNERCGRDAGDLILKAVARQLKESVRTGDVVVRQRGGSFALLLPGLDAEAATASCEAIVERLRDKAYPLKGGERLKVTASMGLATHSPTAPFAAAADLPQAAALALAQAKLAGRDRLQVYRR